MTVYSLSWDHADLSLYREATDCYMPQFLHELSDLEKKDCVNIETVECVYRRLVDILSLSVQCNTLHATENHFAACAFLSVCVCVCARDFGAQYLEKG